MTNYAKVGYISDFYGSSGTMISFTRGVNGKPPVLNLDGIDIPFEEAKMFMDFNKGIIDLRGIEHKAAQFKLNVLLDHILDKPYFYLTCRNDPHRNPRSGTRQKVIARTLSKLWSYDAYRTS